MNALDLVNMIKADGAELTLTANGKLRITGSDVERWHPVIAQYEAQLIDALQANARKQEANDEG